MTTALQTPPRIASIDILRALTMVLMIFVNDLWSLTNIPKWLEHTEADEDGMGLADVVFPAFLFIVGMSIPFAIDNRRKKGDTTNQIVKHIMIRGVALLIMGVFLVNGENINAAATGFPRWVWNVLSCISFILIWNAYPATAKRSIILGLKCFGILILLMLALLYRGGEGDDVHGFATYWWGILGLIGWAYLVSGLVYTFFGAKILNIVIAWLAFHVLCISSHAGWISSDFFEMIISPIGSGAMPALTLGGVVISMIYLHYRDQRTEGKMLVVMGVISVLLFTAGFYTRTFWGISKIHATPAWIMICSALTILAFMAIYWLADMKGKTHLFDIIKPAGTNTLICYLLPYFAYTLPTILAIHFPAFMLNGIAGLIKSFLFALLIVVVAGWLGKRNLQLKL
jgi:heparan-alpha-glucosaminide N-acetyltransferase